MKEIQWRDSERKVENGKTKAKKQYYLNTTY